MSFSRTQTGPFSYIDTKRSIVWEGRVADGLVGKFLLFLSGALVQTGVSALFLPRIFPLVPDDCGNRPFLLCDVLSFAVGDLYAHAVGTFFDYPLNLFTKLLVCGKMI